MARRVPNHRLPVDQLAQLCTGGGGPGALRTLWSGQRSRRLLLLDTVVHKALGDEEAMGPLPAARLGWEALVSAEAAAPAECSALLLHPQVGSWAAYTLRRKRGMARADAPFWIDAGGLHAIAVVAAIRAGQSLHTLLPARDGQVMLPTLGMMSFSGLPRWSAVSAWCDDGVLRISGGSHEVTLPAEPSTDVPGWWPMRRLLVGAQPRLSVFLDDIDPFRELADPVEPQRLDAGTLAQWEELLAGAWELLCREHPATAAVLPEGVRSLVPLPVDTLGATRSASTGEAFGSAMISLPTNEVDLAVALVHEFQHIKLGGLMHLMPVTEGDDQAVWYAPWRDDPRPLAGLVQGAYAFFGIADFWRVRRASTTGTARRFADFEFAYARRQVADVLHTLRTADGLTAVGRDLVHGLSGELTGWWDEPVDHGAIQAASLLHAAHRTEWRLRHLHPDATAVRRRAAAWLAGDADDTRPVHSVVRAHPVTGWSIAWQRSVRQYLRSARTVSAENDLKLLSGDTVAASHGYRSLIAANPGDLHAWTGLSLAADASEPLRCYPELVHAIHAALPGDADPVALSSWLRAVPPSGLRPVGRDDGTDRGEQR